MIEGFYFVAGPSRIPIHEYFPVFIVLIVTFYLIHACIYIQEARSVARRKASPWNTWRRKSSNVLFLYSPLRFPSLNWTCLGTLRWRHNGRDGISNHQPHDCLLNRLFRRRWNKTSKLRVTGLCAGNSLGPVNSPHKWPVTRKMSPFDDVIMNNHGYTFTTIPG